MLITTTPTIEGCQIKEYLGIVTGTSSFLLDNPLAGNGVLKMDERYANSIAYAVNSMQNKALSLGADAIVGICSTCIHTERSCITSVMVSGTAVLTNVKYDAEQKAIQDQIDKENNEREEKRQAEEALQKAFENLEKKSQLDVFLEQANAFTRVSDVKKLWTSLTWEDNQLIQEIDKKINEQASFERIYGASSNSVPNLLKNIQALMDGNTK